MDSIFINVNELPDITKSAMDFGESSFFQSGNPLQQLPEPAALLQGTFPGAKAFHRVIKIEHLNMIVKSNDESWTHLEELQVLWAVQRAFPNGEIPVPELFGWRKYEGRVFIYMSLVHGQTLESLWPMLTAVDKKSLQKQLKNIILSLRRLLLRKPIIGESPDSTVVCFATILYMETNISYIGN
jgi:hypothetical protein